MPSIPPGEGERRAAGGLRPQYLAAADLTLAIIRDVEWVKVADPAAGTADDFQLATLSGQLHALQVKWSAYPEAFTFRALTGGSDSLAGSLADGWQRLSRANAGKVIRIRLVTNDYASTSDSVRPPVAGSPDHFAAFIARSYQLIQDRLRQGRPGTELSSSPEIADWQDAWDELQKSTGLNGEQFWEFIMALELNLGVTDNAFRVASRFSRTDLRDREDLANFYFATVASNRHIVTVTASELLERLGWTDRIAFRNSHVFPVPASYETNETAVSALVDAVSNLGGGYMALIGPAGAGKSTLLSATVLPADRVVRYYAYTPTAPDPSTGRGEAENFFYDLVTALDNAGLRTPWMVDPRDRLGNKERLLRQLDAGHREWEQDRRRTIIVVDGLDHIPREQHPARSLIDDLPNPAQVPAGVFIILGSQLTDILPAAVQASLATPGRTVEVPPLPAAAVLAIADKAGPGRWLLPEQKQRLISVSEGHPLSLRYLLEELGGLTGDPAAPLAPGVTERADVVLADAAAFGARIQERYQGYWQRAAGMHDLHRLLGITARLRSPIDLAWLRTWIEPEVVARFAETFTPFFVKNGSSWTFIHNSFRIFLIERTATVAGRYDSDQHRRLHEDAAEVCAGAGERWGMYRDEEISQRAAAGQHDQVVALAASRALRSRMEQLTPLAAIRHDVDEALRSAGIMGDPVAVLRLAVMKLELGMRSRVLESDDLAVALIGAGEYAAGLRHIMLGRDLRVGLPTALEAAERFLDSGREAEARAIVEAVGSLRVLLETTELDRGPRDDDFMNSVRPWVSVHAGLRPAREILSEINAALPSGSADDADIGRRSFALATLAVALTGSPDAGERTEIVAALAETEPQRAAAIEMLIPAGGSLGDVLVRVDAAFAHLGIAPVPGLDTRWTRELIALVPASLRIDAAEMLAKTQGGLPLAQLLIDGCELRERAPITSDSERSIWLAYRLLRIRCLLHSGGGAESIWPESQPGDGMAIFYAALTELAELDASVWRSRLNPAYGPGPAMSVARQLHRLYEIPLRRRRNRGSWYIAAGAAEAFFQRLVSVVTTADPGSIAALSELFFTAWQSPDRAGYWPFNVRIAVLEGLAKAGANRNEIIGKLLDFRSAITTAEGLDPHERADNMMRLARTLSAVGISADAAEAIRIAVGETLSPATGDNDGYLDQWIRQFENLVKAPGIGEFDLRQAAIRLAVRLDNARAAGAGTRDPAKRLIEVTYGIDPGLGVDMAAWLAERGVLSDGGGMAALLAGAAADPAVPAECVADVLGSVYMPADVDPLPEVAATLLDRASDEVRRIVEGSIRLWVLPSFRVNWHVLTGEAAEPPVPPYIGEPPSPTIDDSAPAEPMGIRHGDGTFLSPEAAADLVSSPAELLDLLRRAEPRGEYDRASPISMSVRKVVGQMRPGDEAALLDQFRRTRADPDSYAAVAARLIAIGAGTRAQHVVDEALRNTTMSGWITYWDGGTRRRFWAELIQADRTRFMPQAIDDLATALSVNAIPLDGLVHDLPVVFGLLGVGPQEIWPVIEEFLGALCKPVGDEIPWRPANRSETSTEALLRRVAALAGHPVRAIDWGARKVLRHALTDERTAEVTARLIAENGSEASMRAEALLAVIASAGPVSSTVIAILRDMLAAAAHVKDQILRDTAQLAATQMGIALQARGRRPLRLSFSLATPPVPSHHVPDTDDDGVQILDPTNPRSSLGTYDSLLDGPISDLSGIPEATLIRQAELLGKQAAEQDPWTRGGIKAHARRIKHGGWLHSYRPWPLMVGRRGTAGVVAELADARYLPDPLPSTVSELFGLIDPPLDLIEPEALPASVSRPARRSRFGGQRGAWTVDTAEAARMYQETRSSEEIIIGEWADWTELSWDQARERRIRVAHKPELMASARPGIAAVPQPGGLGGLEKLMNLDLFHSSKAYRTSASGVAPSASPSDLPLIVGGQGWWSETRAHQWLAIAPELGRRLGWRLSSQGLFEWRNDAGDRMAWSRWWIQCLDTHQPPHFDDDAGEGWQVLLTQAGWLQVSVVLGALEVSTVVARAGARNVGWEQIVRDTRRLISPWESITSSPSASFSK